MPIPKFYEMMLPLLELCSDHQEHSLKDAEEMIAQKFHLTEEEKNELLASGTQRRLYNRITWAKQYLVKAKLLEKVGRSSFKITERGINVLKDNPQMIDINYLKQFPEFLEFINKSLSESNEIDYNDNDSWQIQISKTPEESLDEAYSKMIDNLSEEILERIKTVSPSRFERIVIELLVKMGYGGSLKEAGQVVGKSGDEGIDGIIKEDKLGLDFIYIQAKRWENVVSRPEIQKFAGALLGKKSRKGIFITTSRFSKEAEEYAQSIDAKIILIDGKKLAQLMIEYNLGTTTVNIYEIKKIDQDYFED